jgi:hypothetical protein
MLIYVLGKFNGISNPPSLNMSTGAMVGLCKATSTALYIMGHPWPQIY